MIKNIGVLTSGGDSPGMNAAARAVVRTVLYEGGKVWGIYDGYRGLLDEKMEELTSRSVADILQRGGTFLGTARCKRFMTPEGRMEAYENMKKRGIEGLVVIGGDGSLRGASKLSAETGVPIVGLALSTMMYGVLTTPSAVILPPTPLLMLLTSSVILRLLTAVLL